METLVSLCSKQTREYPHSSQPNCPQNVEVSIKCQFLGPQFFKSIEESWKIGSNSHQPTPKPAQQKQAQATPSPPKPNTNRGINQLHIQLLKKMQKVKNHGIKIKMFWAHAFEQCAFLKLPKHKSVSAASTI